MFTQKRYWGKLNESRPHKIINLDLTLDNKANLDVNKISSDYSLQVISPLFSKHGNQSPELRWFPLNFLSSSSSCCTGMGGEGNGMQIYPRTHCRTNTPGSPALGPRKPCCLPTMAELASATPGLRVSLPRCLEVLSVRTWACLLSGTITVPSVMLFLSFPNGMAPLLHKREFSVLFQKFSSLSLVIRILPQNYRHSSLCWLCRSPRTS